MEDNQTKNPLRRISKQKRLQEIAQYRQDFRSLRRSIKEFFPASNARNRVKSSAHEAQEYEKSAQEFEISDPNQELVTESYAQAALNYHDAGVYSVLLSDPKSAWLFFKDASRCYTRLAELIHDEPLSLHPHIAQDALISKNYATIARHEAACRRARRLLLTFGLCDRIQKFLKK